MVSPCAGEEVEILMFLNYMSQNAVDAAVYSYCSFEFGLAI